MVRVGLPTGRAVSNGINQRFLPSRGSPTRILQFAGDKVRTSTEASTQMRGIYRPRLLVNSCSPRAWPEPLCLENVRCCHDTGVFHKGWRGPLAIQRVRSPQARRGMPRSPWQSDHPRASPREGGASGFLSSAAAPSTDGLVRGTSLRRSTHTPIPGCRRTPGIIIITSEVIEL